MKESWLPLFRYEDFYLISSFGRIKNVKGRYNKFYKNEKGYLCVRLSKNGKSSLYRVHRLVALTFLGYSTVQVNHKDGNKLNNKIENLEWITNQENRNHAVKNNLIAKHEAHGFSKLDKKSVVFIRKYIGYLTQEQLSGIFKVNQSTISRIVNEKIWRY